MLGKVNDYQALMSICASVFVKRSSFGERKMKALFWSPFFYIVTILIFCQSHLLFSQHMVNDCAVLDVS